MTSDDTLDLDLTEIKRQYKKACQSRYKRFGRKRYSVDRWMFQLGMFLIFGWLLFVANWYHYDLDYYQCTTPAGYGVEHPIDYGGDQHGKREYYFQDQGCRNPFYRETTWKNQQYLPPGEYGTKLGHLFESVFYVPFLIFGLAIGLNHIINHRRRRSR